MIIIIVFMKSNYNNNHPLFLKGLLNQRKHRTVINLNCKNNKIFQLPSLSSTYPLLSFIEIK